MTIGEAKKKAAFLLATTSPSPALDATVLLAHVLTCSSSYLMANPEIQLKNATETFFKLIDRRLTGEPIAYITGVKEFWNLPFKVSPAVLIPKPDTELLIERALSIIPPHKEVSSSYFVLDVCTGSGCIAISIKKERTFVEMRALDISKDALVVAQQNADALVGGAITFFLADLREGLPLPKGSSQQGYQLIVSNPPYVPSDMARALLEDGRNEPLLALDGGSDGCELIRPLAKQVFCALEPGGTFLVETGEYNALQSAQYLKELGFIDILIHKDLANQDRLVEGKKP